jgi:Ubiquitin-conjugating enzyme
LCRSILSVRELLRRTSQFDGVSPQVTKENYSALCSRLAYEEYPFDSPFHFNNISMTPTPINPKRTLTLAKELSTMATSLPPGIFIRSQQNRPDCIKALIAGPDGTPYYHGLFEFDIFATPNYPAEPPKVHFLTTAGGRVRFNPNLYAY